MVLCVVCQYGQCIFYIPDMWYFQCVLSNKICLYNEVCFQFFTFCCVYTYKNQSIHKLASCTRCVSMVLLVSGCCVSIKVFPCVYNQCSVMTE